MLEDALKVLSVLALATTKHAFGVALAAAYGYSYLATVALGTAGGTLGIIIYLYFGRLIEQAIQHFWPSFQFKLKMPGERTQRFVEKYGLAGLALLTPFVFTVPVGALLALALNYPRLQIILYNFVSLLLWSMVLAVFALVL